MKNDTSAQRVHAPTMGSRILGVIIILALIMIVPWAYKAVRRASVDNPYVKEYSNYTRFFVHVRADLTIDGQPLVMDRNIRCFTTGQEPTDLYASADTLTAQTNAGRVFALIVPNICSTLRGSYQQERHGFYNPWIEDVPSLRLSRDELEIPVVFEIHGGRAATQIDAYIAVQRLRQGYHGVQLNDVLIEKANITKEQWDFAKEREAMDWFGPPNWFRPKNNDGKTRYYVAAFSIPITEDYWRDPLKIRPEHEAYRRAKPEDVKSAQEYANYLAGLTQDTNFALNDQKFRSLIGFFDVAGFAAPLYELGKLRPDQWAERQNNIYAWAINRLIPCRFVGKGNYICSPEMDGVLQFSLAPSLFDLGRFNSARGISENTYVMPNFTMQLSGNRGALYRAEDRIIYSGFTVQGFLGRDE